jgi:L-2-hydroxyglutarate oxidase LhgO
MDSTQTDLVIIGAGIVGLATAMKAVQRFPGLRTVVLEKESTIAAHQSSHNSGVIHSGIYYRPGSLKAKLCVTGAAAMVAFCREHDVPHDVCGKVIVATSEPQIKALQELQRRAVQNRLSGVRWLKREEIRDFEPHVSGLAALHTPSTGIVNYSVVAKKYSEIFASDGGDLRTNAKVFSIEDSADRFVIETAGGTFETKFLINCAGLYSDRIARLAGVDPGLKILPFRGEFYELVPEKCHLVRSLIYPVADPRFPFLGVHFTRHIGGGIGAGPSAVLALRREGYTKTSFDFAESIELFAYSGFWMMAAKYWATGLAELWRSASKRSFTSALQQLIPEVQSADLVPARSGVRAQAVTPSGVLLDDFHFVQRGRALHVCNVPSPAATASLTISDQIVQMAARQFGLKSGQSLAGKSS